MELFKTDINKIHVFEVMDVQISVYFATWKIKA
jgi:hypothetical protein